MDTVITPNLRRIIRHVVKKELEEEKKREQLLDTNLYRKDVVDRVRSLEFIINLHLMKMVLYPKDRFVNKWTRDIMLWLTECGSKTYHQNKKLKSTDYYNILFGESFHDEDGAHYAEVLFEEVVDFYESSENYDGYTKPIFGSVDVLPAESIKKKFKDFYFELSEYFANNLKVQPTHIKKIIQKHFSQPFKK